MYASAKTFQLALSFGVGSQWLVIGLMNPQNQSVVMSVIPPQAKIIWDSANGSLTLRMNMYSSHFSIHSLISGLLPLKYGGRSRRSFSISY